MRYFRILSAIKPNSHKPMWENWPTHSAGTPIRLWPRKAGDDATDALNIHFSRIKVSARRVGPSMLLRSLIDLNSSILSKHARLVSKSYRPIANQLFIHCFRPAIFHFPRVWFWVVFMGISNRATCLHALNNSLKFIFLRNLRLKTKKRRSKKILMLCCFFSKNGPTPTKLVL